MSYLHYQYCLANFIVLDSYEQELFDVDLEEIEDIHQMYYKLLISNITGKFKGEDIKGQLRRVFVSPKTIKAFIEKDVYSLKYDPLSDTPELYIEMNKVNILDDQSLMKFISNYGIPFHQQIAKNSSGVYPTSLFQQNETEKLLIGMDALMFYEELIKFKDAFTLWRDIKENKRDKLQLIKRIIQEDVIFYDKHGAEFLKDISQEDFARMVFAELGFTYEGEIEEVLEEYKNDPTKIKLLSQRASDMQILWDEIKDKDDKTIAIAYLDLKLKKLKSGKTSTKFIKGSIVPAISFNNLMEVANYQLKQAIFKDSMLERCINCDALFEPRHAHQKFCSPLPNRKRSTCENTYNQRLKRQRRKEKTTLQ